jgi:hypothetical protein
MSNTRQIYAIVEGPTEKQFIKELLAPFLAPKNIILTPVILSKPGEKGGDVKFSRAKRDIEKFLKQRADTQLTLMVDYYGIRNDWPGLDKSRRQPTHTQKHDVLMKNTAAEIQRLFPEQNPRTRFIPYFSMHEIEALYFCDADKLAQNLGVSKTAIEDILQECDEPEKINDSSETAPSKRLEALSQKFKKTTTGLTIAKAIGIPAMRATCPLFNAWITRLETTTSPF